MSIIGVNHIGIAPKDSEKAKSFLRDVLGLAELGEELVASQKTLTTMFDSGESSARLEILEPLESSGPIQSFLEKRGGGIHHIALSVNGLDGMLENLKDKGVKLINEVPEKGAHGTRVVFVHPSAAGGVLIELVEKT